MNNPEKRRRTPKVPQETPPDSPGEFDIKPQAASRSAQNEPNGFQKVSGILAGLFGVYWLCSTLIGCLSSDYSTADRLTRELIQEMNDVAAFTETVDPTGDLTPAMEKKMEDSKKRMESKTKQLASLKLSNSEKAKLKSKYKTDLEQAQKRLDVAMATMMRKVFSKMQKDNLRKQPSRPSPRR